MKEFAATRSKAILFKPFTWPGTAGYILAGVDPPNNSRAAALLPDGGVQSRAGGHPPRGERQRSIRRGWCGSIPVDGGLAFAAVGGDERFRH